MSYISIKSWAEKNNVDVQSVYRWIREHKFGEKDLTKQIVEKEILKISVSAKIPNGCGNRKIK